MFFYLITKFIKRNRSEVLSPRSQVASELQLKTKINPLLFAIPAGTDFIGCTLMFMALTQVAASIY
jgi:hypothetical protein